MTILSNSPSVEAQDWFIPQDQVFTTRVAVNEKAGTRPHAGTFHDHDGMGGSMQKRYGFKPLGPANGPLKAAIFGGNSAKLYRIEQQHAELVNHDRFLGDENQLPR